MTRLRAWLDGFLSRLFAPKWQEDKRRGNYHADVGTLASHPRDKVRHLWLAVEFLTAAANDCPSQYEALMHQAQRCCWRIGEAGDAWGRRIQDELAADQERLA